jgi:hypothetical protein
MKIYVVMWEKDCYYGSVDERIGIMVVHSMYLDEEVAASVAKGVGGEVEVHEVL